jgi:hypothetical protein
MLTVPTKSESKQERANYARRTLLPTSVSTVFGLTVGGTTVVATFGFSLAVSSYHIRVHEAPILPAILGQGSLFVVSLVSGLVGYIALTNVEAPSERAIVGLHAGTGYGLAGLASGGSALHQYLTPETPVGFEVILFQATFVALVGGTAGIIVGFEKARRERTVDDLEATTRKLGATQAEIRTEKQRFESLFQNAPSAIADLQYTGTEPRVERANAAFEDRLEPPMRTSKARTCSRSCPSRRRRRNRSWPSGK